MIGKEKNFQIIYYYLFSMYSNIKIDSQNEVWQQYHMQVVRRTQVDMTQTDPGHQRSVISGLEKERRDQMGKGKPKGNGTISYLIKGGAGGP